MVEKKRNRLIIMSLVLMFILVASIILRTTQPMIANASINGTNVKNSIDYSGQGTIITGDIREASCSVNGEYVNVPTYSYGANVYNEFDAFWAGWSSWSPDNQKYKGCKGYRYAAESKYIIDFQEKTEYKYRRWKSNLNPVYRTRYYTKYKTTKKVLWWYVDTYSVESSFNGYPGNISGKTITEKWTKTELSHYAGGYEYTDWRDNKPLALTGWPFYEKEWSQYNSRQTYRVKSCKTKWDANYKNNSTELVPLNYAIYSENGSPIGVGNKWNYNKELSGHKSIYTTTTNVTRYMLNSNGIEILLNGKEGAIDQLIRNNSSWAEVMLGIGVGVAGFKANPYVAVALFAAESLGTIMQKVVDDNKEAQYDNLKAILGAAKNYGINVVFEFYETYTILPDCSSHYENLNVFTSQKKYMSMRYQSNENPSFGYFTSDAYGKVTYDFNVGEIVQRIDNYVLLKSLPLI